jgi:hypothetical protein
MTEPRKRFNDLRRSAPIAYDDLEEFWSLLAPVAIDFMIGEWKGGEFQTGHRANGFMQRLNWFGKTFHSATDAKPLVCLDSDGNKYSNTEAMKGEASLWLEDFRGEVTASMVYDGAPVHDHFKRVDENAVLGIMNGKGAIDDSSGSPRHLYFYLERV